MIGRRKRKHITMERREIKNAAARAPLSGRFYYYMAEKKNVRALILDISGDL